MNTPNPQTIRPIAPAQVARLGEKISDHPSLKHRTWTPILVGITAVILLVTLVFLILVQGWSAWLWILVPILALFAWGGFERYPIKGLSIYENGIVLIHDLNNGLQIYNWNEIEVGLTEWENKTEYYICCTDNPKAGACLDSDFLSGDMHSINVALKERPQYLLHQYWNEALNRGETVNYRQVELRLEGLHFKKIDTTLNWDDFDSWSVNETWEIVFGTADGRIIQPKIFTYEVPYLASLFEFAKGR